MLSFTIPGEAKGKARPRFFKRGKFVGTYTPQQTQNYENLVKLYFSQEHPAHTPIEEPIEMEIIVYTAIPKSYSKGKHLAASHNIIRPAKKPDVDNIIKAIADSLNGIAYKDDAQIVKCSIVKLFGDPKVIVNITELETA